MPERSKGAGCKPAGFRLRWFKSTRPHHSFVFYAGIAQLVEHQPSKLRVAGSNPVSRSICPVDLHPISPCSSAVEHLLGKEEVTSSSLVMGSIFKP